MTDRTQLTPSQERAVARVQELLPCANVFVLWAPPGLGKSTMLHELHSRIGGRMIALKDTLDVLQHRHPLAIEESFRNVVLEALADSDVVLVDDLSVVEQCRGHFCPRSLLDAALTTACVCAEEAEKTLIFTGTGRAPEPVNARCLYSGLQQFEIGDYRHLCSAYLGVEATEALDLRKVYRFAPNLNAFQIRSACEVLKLKESVDTERFIDYLVEHRLASNVVLSEVEYVDLGDLRGVDHVLQALDTHVIVPFEHDELAEELDLRPKKGVLIYGPPGTGKTTIGRALAHRLKGKFFLIDGTFVSGSDDFFCRVKQVFEAAKQNAPSIIFIDDSDVLWENEDDTGFYRYLLTELDGLEGSDSAMVCVMMTAMNVGKLPAALIRSGRMELWLEMPLPDEEARSAIIEHWVGRLPESMRDVDVRRVTKATAGFTGADLRRLVGDAKNLYAYDRAKLNPILSPTDYFLRAVDVVLENRRQRADAESKAGRDRELGSAYQFESDEPEMPPVG